MKKIKKGRFSFDDSIEENPINLTPLLDVIFVVLIAFILIAPLLEIDNVNLANASERPEKNIREKPSLALYVREDNSIWINNRKIMEKDLPFTLKDLKKKNPGKELKIFHDKKGYFGTYQNIKNAAELAGFSEMQVILKPNGL